MSRTPHPLHHLYTHAHKIYVSTFTFAFGCRYDGHIHRRALHINAVPSRNLIAMDVRCGGTATATRLSKSSARSGRGAVSAMATAAAAAEATWHVVVAHSIFVFNRLPFRERERLVVVSGTTRRNEHDSNLCRAHESETHARTQHTNHKKNTRKNSEKSCSIHPQASVYVGGDGSNYDVEEIAQR